MTIEDLARIIWDESRADDGFSCGYDRLPEEQRLRSSKASLRRQARAVVLALAADIETMHAVVYGPVAPDDSGEAFDRVRALIAEARADS